MGNQTSNWSSEKQRDRISIKNNPHFSLETTCGFSSETQQFLEQIVTQKDLYPRKLDGVQSDQQSVTLNILAFSDPASFQIRLQKLQKRISFERQQFLLQVHKIETHQAQNFCSVSKNIVVVLEDYQMTLGDLIRQQVSRKQCFSEDEVVALIKSITEALIWFHDCDSIKSIFMNKESIILRKGFQHKELPYLKTQKHIALLDCDATQRNIFGELFEAIVESKPAAKESPIENLATDLSAKLASLYLSPQTLEILGEEYSPKMYERCTECLKTSKSDIFSLGMIAMELCCNEQMSFCYGFGGENCQNPNRASPFDYESLIHRIAKISYSNDLKMLIAEMLEYEPRNRIGLISLHEKIQTLLEREKREQLADTEEESKKMKRRSSSKILKEMLSCSKASSRYSSQKVMQRHGDHGSSKCTAQNQKLFSAQNAGDAVQEKEILSQKTEDKTLRKSNSLSSVSLKCKTNTFLSSKRSSLHKASSSKQLIVNRDSRLNCGESEYGNKYLQPESEAVRKEKATVSQSPQMEVSGKPKTSNNYHKILQKRIRTEPRIYEQNNTIESPQPQLSEAEDDQGNKQKGLNQLSDKRLGFHVESRNHSFVKKKTINLDSLGITSKSSHKQRNSEHNQVQSSGVSSRNIRKVNLASLKQRSYEKHHQREDSKITKHVQVKSKVDLKRPFKTEAICEQEKGWLINKLKAGKQSCNSHNTNADNSKLMKQSIKYVDFVENLRSETLPKESEQKIREAKTNRSASNLPNEQSPSIINDLLMTGNTVESIQNPTEDYLKSLKFQEANHRVIREFDLYGSQLEKPKETEVQNIIDSSLSQQFKKKNLAKIIDIDLGKVHTQENKQNRLSLVNKEQEEPSQQYYTKKTKSSKSSKFKNLTIYTQTEEIESQKYAEKVEYSEHRDAKETIERVDTVGDSDKQNDSRSLNEKFDGNTELGSRNLESKREERIKNPDKNLSILSESNASLISSSSLSLITPQNNMSILTQTYGGGITFQQQPEKKASEQNGAQQETLSKPFQQIELCMNSSIPPLTLDIDLHSDRFDLIRSRTYEANTEIQAQNNFSHGVGSPVYSKSQALTQEIIYHHKTHIEETASFREEGASQKKHHDFSEKERIGAATSKFIVPQNYTFKQDGSFVIREEQQSFGRAENSHSNGRKVPKKNKSQIEQKRFMARMDEMFSSGNQACVNRYLPQNHSSPLSNSCFSRDCESDDSMDLSRIEEYRGFEGQSVSEIPSQLKSAMQRKGVDHPRLSLLADPNPHRENMPRRQPEYQHISILELRDNSIEGHNLPNLSINISQFDEKSNRQNSDSGSNSGDEKYNTYRGYLESAENTSRLIDLGGNFIYEGAVDSEGLFDGNGILSKEVDAHPNPSAQQEGENFCPNQGTTKQLIYSGAFVRGLYHGFGTLYAFDEETLSNKILKIPFTHLKKDHKKSPESQRITFGNEKNKPQMFCSYTPIKYEGEFEEGVENRFGTYYFANGDRFVGCFDFGTVEGYGSYYFKSGEVIEGIWKNNCFSG